LRVIKQFFWSESGFSAWKNPFFFVILHDMRIIKQLGLILAFGLAGEILARLIPATLPASVLGLFLMLLFLGLKILKPEHLGETADYLSANMGFFFLPAVASVLNNYDLIAGAVLPLLAICIACTFFTFGLTYGTVRLFQRLMSKGG
jgi:holin-like protein